MKAPVVDYQLAVAAEGLPSKAQLRLWLQQVFTYEAVKPVAVTVRVVDASEMRSLNNTYRQQDKPTNVLSFPADWPPDVAPPYLGDLVVCAEVVAAEADQQQKSLEAHWAHMIVHGILHLLGYDHEDDAEATDMERRETEILQNLGYAPPYSDMPMVT